jgi:hypothetical protein
VLVTAAAGDQRGRQDEETGSSSTVSSIPRYDMLHVNSMAVAEPSMRK